MTGMKTQIGAALKPKTRRKVKKWLAYPALCERQEYCGLRQSIRSASAFSSASMQKSASIVIDTGA
jgi:hypothetical protein